MGVASRYLASRSAWNHPILGEHGEMSPEQFATRAIIGNLDDAIQSLQRYAAMGVDQVNFRLSFEGLTPDQVWETAMLLASEVMPAFGRAVA